MTSEELIRKYVQDAEAAERNFEDALATFGKSGDQEEVQRFFKWASAKAKSQHERLEARLRELGGSPSLGKSFLAHILALSTTAAQIGQEPAEKNTQNLIMCIAAAAAEMAMYESLALVSEAAGDTQTERLARELQKEEKEDYDKSWNLLASSAKAAYSKVASSK
jgi:ferritin-like metal-binding protein YciE